MAVRRLLFYVDECHTKLIKEKIMRIYTLSAVLAFVIFLSFTSVVHADTEKEKALHDMHMLMRFMDHGISVSLKGADLQMLGHMGQSDKMDRDSIVHGTIMVKDGRAIIKEMLEGKAMRELYKEGNFDKPLMDDLHKLGEKMLEVIDLVQKIHENAIKQASGK
jgi:hypothetical protein